jgi:hypothetical protein
MTPLLWFLAGACFGALCGVVLMALMAAASQADELEGEAWVRDQLAAWEGEGGVYDHEAGPDFNRNVELREALPDFELEDHPTRRSTRWPWR